MSENTENNKPQDSSQDNIKDKGVDSFDEAQAINAEPHSQDTERAVTTWRPEDAANFFAKAINESQKPLAKALARPSVPAGIVWLIIIVLALFIGGLLFRLHKLQQKNEEIVNKKISRTVVAQDENNIRKVESVIGNLVKRLNKDKVKKAEKDELETRLEDLSHTLKETMLELEEKEDQIKQAEKSKGNIKAASDKIEKLAIELEALRQEKNKVEKLKKREAKANKLLVNQLDAQREAIAALQKQLDAADKLAKALQGHDLEEEKPEGKSEEKETKAAPQEEKETKTKQEDADLEGMM